MRPVTPSPSDRKLATAALPKIHRSRKARGTLQIGSGPQAEIPASAVGLLKDILRAMADGQTVTLIPGNTELTTQQAADLLNVSRPYLVKLLDEGRVPSRKVGSHRRVRFEDLMAYRQKLDEQSAKALTALAEEAQKLGLGY